MASDAAYFINFVFIPIFKDTFDSYRDDIRTHYREQNQSYRYWPWLIFDVIMSTFALYVTFSLFLYMLFEDWMIEHIVKDAAHAQYANIIIENFLVFEWIHQFVDYVFFEEHTFSRELIASHSGLCRDDSETNYVGLFMFFSWFQCVVIIWRMFIPSYYLYDMDIKEWGEKSQSIQFIVACFVEMVGSAGFLWYLLRRLLRDRSFYRVIKAQVQTLSFAAILWFLLLVIDIAYANFSHLEFFIQFFINLFIYPIFFIWILVALHSFHQRRRERGNNNANGACVTFLRYICCSTTGCCSDNYFCLDFSVLVFAFNAGSFVVYGVFKDIDKIGSKWLDQMYQLIFMMIVVENSLLLEALHMVFPIFINGILIVLDVKFKHCCCCCGGLEEKSCLEFWNEHRCCCCCCGNQLHGCCTRCCCECHPEDPEVDLIANGADYGANLNEVKDDKVNEFQLETSSDTIQNKKAGVEQSDDNPLLSFDDAGAGGDNSLNNEIIDEVAQDDPKNYEETRLEEQHSVSVFRIPGDKKEDVQTHVEDIKVDENTAIERNIKVEQQQTGNDISSVFVMVEEYKPSYFSGIHGAYRYGNRKDEENGERQQSDQ